MTDLLAMPVDEAATAGAKRVRSRGERRQDDRNLDFTLIPQTFRNPPSIAERRISGYNANARTNIILLRDGTGGCV